MDYPSAEDSAGSGQPLISHNLTRSQLKHFRVSKQGVLEG